MGDFQEYKTTYATGTVQNPSYSQQTIPVPQQQQFPQQQPLQPQQMQVVAQQPVPQPFISTPSQPLQQVPQQLVYQQPSTHENEKRRDLSKIKGVLQFTLTFIETILIVRFILLLLGARSSDFSLLMFQLTDPLILPFKGTFVAPGASGAYFDSAAILAIIIYALVFLGIKELVDILFSKDK